MQPVNITVGPGGAPDQIDVLYGNSSFYVSQEPLQGATATSKTLRRRNGFRPGDLAIVAGNPGAGFGSANCALIEITGAANPDNKTLDHGMANYTSFYTGAHKAVRYNTVAGVGAGFASGMMYSLGPNPQLARWRITTTANGVGALADGADLQHGAARCRRERHQSEGAVRRRHRRQRPHHQQRAERVDGGRSA